MAVRGRLLYAATVGERGKGCFAAWSCAFLWVHRACRYCAALRYRSCWAAARPHSLQMLPAGAW